MSKNKLPKLPSVRTVSETTFIPKSTIYDAIYNGELPAYRFGRAVRLDERDVERWIQSRREVVG